MRVESVDDRKVEVRRLRAHARGSLSCVSVGWIKTGRNMRERILSISTKGLTLRLAYFESQTTSGLNVWAAKAQ
jgi:hypothetical protein